MHDAAGGTHLRARPIVLSVAVFLLLTLLVVVPAGPARAAIFAVDSTTDVAGSGDLTDGTCDDGAANCTLRAAVQEANGTTGADVITLAATTYTLSIGGAPEDAGAAGDLDITEDVTINGAATGTTIDAATLDRVFHVQAGATLTLSNVTITGGSAATGGGIQVDATGALDLDVATLTANTATGHGGAIYAAGDVTADLVTISGNTAGTTAGDGGGFYAASGSHTLTSVTVAYNIADNGGGLARAVGTLTIDHSIVATNTATTGLQCSGSISSAGYNVFSSLAGCTFTAGTGDQTGVAAGIAPTLADNGGPSDTHALNAASNSLDVGGTCSTTDQRGVTRGLTCDAGAFEAVQINFSPASATHGEFTTQAMNVTLDGSDPNRTVTATVQSAGGTATLGTDYTLSGTAISFAPGTSSGQSATVDIAPDDIDEGASETATFGFTGNANTLLGTADTFSLTITDNDTAGITLTPTNLTFTEGGPAQTYDIELASQPTAAVTVNITDGTEADAASTSVPFTTGNWDTPQTVSVSVPNNAIADGTRLDSITHASTSTDTDYNGAGPDLSVTINDDDSESITVTETAGSTDVAEAGATTDTYTVTLGTAPVGTVTITPTFGADITVTPGSRAFTSADWNSDKVFTVTAVNDQIDEALVHTATITHAVSAPSDAGYAAITPSDVVANVTDNDTAGVTVTESAGSTSVDEDGATSDTYDIVLNTRPTNNVTVTPSFGPDVTVTPASLVFTNGNWALTQTFTVTAVDDFIAEPDPHTAVVTHAATSSDGNYNAIGISSVSAAVADDDTAGVSVVESAGSTVVSEAGATTDTYTVRLESRPSANVTVTPSFGPDVTVTPASLVFTNGNWASTQTFTVTAVNDFIDEPDPHTAIVSHAAASIDSNYDGISIVNVSASVADNDTAGVTVTESGGTAVNETGPTSDTYTVRLESRPSANVTVTPSFGPDVTVTPASLVFTNGNWASTQTFTVTAVNDFIDEASPHFDSVTHVASSIDGNYDGISVAGVSVSVTDNDTAGVNVVELGGSTDVAEAGETSDTYTVVLTSRPTANVTVAPSFGADVSVTPASRVFTPSGWATPLVFTVTAVDDTIDEFDPHFATITHGSTSGDSNYSVVPIADVVASVADDDNAGVTIVESAGSTAVSEVGPSSDTYTVRLATRPTANVTITPSFGADVSVTPAQLVFTNSNWASTQTFTVTAVNDFIDEFDPHTATITHAATSSDGNYAGIGIGDVVADVADDDTAAIVIAQSGGSTVVNEAGATTDTYTVRLATRPTANVTVTPSSGADVSVTPASVVFTDANWANTRTFTVTAVNDDLDEMSPHAAPITHAAASADSNYGGLSGPTVNASVLDNDTAGVTITPTTLVIGEGAPGQSYTIVLDTEPTGTVNVAIANTTGEANPSLTSLGFGPGNWSNPRTITVTAPNNGVADGVRTDTMTHTITSGDGNYDAISADDVSVTINDDEGPAMVDIEDVAQVETDGTTTFTFNVTVVPQAAAPITLTYSTAEASFDPADPDEFEQLTNAQIVIPAFTGSDTIEVDAFGDDLDEGDERFRVNITGVVGGVQVDGAVATINDDDATPDADDEAYSVDEGATLIVNVGTGVLVGDTDGDPGTLTAQLVIPPADHVGGFTLNPNGSFTYTNDGDDGADSFTYRASDGTNSSSPATVTINVDNVDPTVSIDGEPVSSTEGTVISLDSTANDPGNDTVALTWSIEKDGVPFGAGSGPAFSFTPTDHGSYVVTLDADDGDGGTHSDSVSIDVTNVNPVVTTVNGDGIDEGDTFTLAAAFTDVGEAERHTATVNWGDGTSDDCTLSPSCEVTQTTGLSGTVTGAHTYVDDGPWTVTVTVDDGLGAGGNTATVIVANVAPTFDLSEADDIIDEGDTYTFDGAFTDPGTGDTWLAEVNYQNGADFVPLSLSGMTFSLSNTYANDSVVPRTVTVCVADDDQGPDPEVDGTCQTTSVTINNAAPVVVAREDADVNENSTVTLTGLAATTFTDAGLDDTHTATVDWGEVAGPGPEPATVNPGLGTITESNLYEDPGLYTVTVTVMDDGGAVGTDTFVVDVQNLAFTVDVSGPQVRNEGGFLTVTGGFDDTDGIGTYDVLVDWGDGSPIQTVAPDAPAPNDGTGTFRAGPHKYADDTECVSAPGSCILVVTIDDRGSLDEGFGGYTVTVNNLDPTTAVAGPVAGDEGTWVQLMGNPSDVAADTLTYEWTVTKDTGDGPAVFKTGAFENVFFLPDDGCATCVYEATFTATDDDGGSTTEVWIVDVANVAPDAKIRDEFGNPLPPVSDQGKEGTTVTLVAAVTDPGAADTHTYSWEVKLLADVIDVGDQPTFDFVAPDNGTYFVVLTVTDDDGDTDTVAPIVTVTNAVPQITELVTDPTPSAGSPVTLNVFFTEPGVGDENSVTVNWGDGTTPDTVSDVTSPAALNHTFSAGAHKAQICVSDDDGGQQCKKIWYNVGGGSVSVEADFNGDGIQDLAVGVPGENSGRGAVNVLYGAPWGAKFAGDQFFRQGVNGVLGSSETGDEFGAVLAHGDFNGDGFDDLAIAAPGEALNGKSNAGAVNVLYGSGSGLTTGGDQLWTQESNFIADVSETGDRFGDSLATGDFNGDGFADLAVGVPGEDQGGKANAGRVQVIFGSPSKLVGGFSQSWHQDVKGVLNWNQPNDNFGAALTSGDFDSDGFWDVAIGIPGQTVAGNGRAGAVAVLPGSVLGLTAVDNQFWHQDKSGVNDVAEANDEFGRALVTGDFDDDGFADLAIGIPLEGISGLSDAGAVAVLYGSGTGIAAAGDQVWHEDTTGIFGVAAADDQFGFALAVGDSTGDGFDDIVIGIPNQKVGGKAGAGTVALIRGSASGLSATGNQRWHENRADTAGTAEVGDHYGASVAFRDVAADGLDDLIAGIPGEDFTPADVGAVALVRGHFSGGFTRYGDQYYHQNNNGMAGDGAQAGDEFGGAL